MVEKNNLEIIIENLDSDTNLQEYIEEVIVEENFRDPEQSLYDEEGKFIYNKALIDFLKSNESIASLSNDEFNLLLDMVVKNILHRIETKGYAHTRAMEGAYNEEYRSYYGGSTESTYGHLFERYLYDFNYNKSMSDFYAEYLDEKEKKK